MSLSIFKKITFLILLILSNESLAFSQDDSLDEKPSPFELEFEKDRPRTFILPPLFSLFIPGFDQLVEGQHAYMGIYAAVGFGGLGTGIGLSKLIQSRTDANRYHFYRPMQLGFQIYQGAGEMSAYHSFRSAVKSRQHQGDFLFLKHEETPTDLLLSPFHFKYITQPTTYIGIPALLASAILIHKLMYPAHQLFHAFHTPRVDDVFFAGAFSMNAGIGEEAFFRGWMMPVTMHYLNSEFFSNLITSSIFGAAHYGPMNKIPIPQAVVGFYLGYIAQKNEWKLGESIFIHAWYDVIAFLAAYSMASKSSPKPAFYLSPITIPL